jgi:Pentapeptide repeats (8 copies)
MNPKKGAWEREMEHCNELCTKEATGKCALCDALAERDRFIRLWFKGGLFIDGIRVLRRWCYPVSYTEIRHKDVVREAHKQYSETLNKAMLTLLGVALFCLLTSIGSPDTSLLAANSTIKVPFADTPIPFLGFIFVASFLLIVLVIYLHIFFWYWLGCERERQYINQTLVGTNEAPIESIPTLFSFPDAFSRLLTGFIFYWLIPLVLVTITWKAWALPAMGLPLTYVSGVVTFILVFLQIRRRPDNQRKWWDLQSYTILLLIIGLIVGTTFNPQSFQRPFNLFRAELPKAWLAGINMRRASAGFANFDGANLQRANLQGANLQGANLQEARLEGANLQDTNLQQARLEGANLQDTKLQQAHLQNAKLLGADLLARSLAPRGPTSWEPNFWTPTSRTPTSRRPTSRTLTSRGLTFGEPSSRGLTFSGPTCRGPTCRGPTLWTPTLWTPTFWGLTSGGPSLQAPTSRGPTSRGPPSTGLSCLPRNRLM